MLVQSIMTAPVITIRPDDSLADAIGLLNYHKLSGLAVVDVSGRLVGILSEGDLLRRIEIGTAVNKDHWWSPLFATDGIAEAYKRANGRKVADVMTDKPVSIASSGTLADAARLMDTHHIKRLPVMRGDALVGMLSRSDFVKVLGEFVAPAYEEQATSDGEIKKRILAEIANQTWALQCRIEVAVANGRVVLSGHVPSDKHFAAARVAAETVTGVRFVENQIVVNETAPIYAM